jgi:hypothetical protein
MDSVCEENVAKLKEQLNDKKSELKQVEETTVETMWSQELMQLVKSL